MQQLPLFKEQTPEMTPTAQLLLGRELIHAAVKSGGIALETEWAQVKTQLDLWVGRAAEKIVRTSK
jgi:hypothetical protein